VSTPDEYADDYPRCYELGVLTVADHRPLIYDGTLKAKLTADEWNRFEQFIHRKTTPIHGFYAWDVERFLRTMKR
jgi:hypothetical protein